MKSFEVPDLIKKDSGINKIVHPDTEIVEDLKGIFDEKFRSLENIKKYGKELPEEAVETIEVVNQFLLEFLEKYGVAAITLTPEKVINVDLDKLSPEDRATLSGEEAGSYSPHTQSVFVVPDWEESKLHFMQVLVHEMMHLNSYQSVQLRKGISPKDDLGLQYQFSKDSDWREVLTRRVGLNVLSRDETTHYFRFLDEAVIEELAIRFGEQYFDKMPSLAKEQEDILPRRKDNPELASFSIWPKDGGFEARRNEYAYQKYRNGLKDIISKIHAKFPEEFKDEEEIFTLFAKSLMTGNILPIARIIEKTFGKGKFRKLGEASETKL